MEFRYLSSEWLQVRVTHKFLSKQFSTFMTKNCTDHLNKYKIVGLTPDNAEKWFSQVLEDKAFCPIHTFEFAGFFRLDLKLSFEVPIDIKPYKSDALVDLPDLLSIKIVIYYPFDEKTGLYKRENDTLITAFLHDRPYLDDEIEALKNPCVGTFYWGGDVETMQSYIKKVALRGLNFLIPKKFKDQKPVFQLLKTQRVKNKTGKFVERRANILEDFWRKQRRNDPFCEIFGPDADTLSKDLEYNQKSKKTFGPLAEILNQNYKKFLFDHFDIFF